MSVSAPSLARVSQPRTARTAEGYSVSVLNSFASAKADWLDLQSRTAPSPYQCFHWAEAWWDTIGRADGIEPALLVVRDRSGSPIGLFPLGSSTSAGLKRAGFLGGRDSNGNAALLSPDFEWTADLLGDVLRRAAQVARIDVFSLEALRAEWRGVANPLLRLPHQRAASDNHAVVLRPDPDEFLRELLSAKARKQMRAKRKKLEAFAPITIRQPETRAELASWLDVYEAQSRARLAHAGIAARADGAAFRAFMLRAGDPEIEVRSVQVFAMTVGAEASNLPPRVIALFAGCETPDRLCGMITSYEAEEPFASQSPGLILIAEVMARCCRAGVASFDLGVGEAPYKDKLCPIVEPLFDSYVGTSLKGRLAVFALSAAARLKTGIKRNARIWEWAQSLRKLRA